MLFGRSKELVGLDIGDSSIKVVELKQVGRSRGWEVVSIANEPLPQEAIVEGTIMDAGLVVDTLRRIWDQKKIRTRKVATSLSGNSVIIRRINLPAMSEAELAEQIHWEAEQYIPFNIAEVSLDYLVLDEAASGEDENMDVILVAARKEKIEDYTSVIRQAGLEPAVVDVGTFAALTCFEANYSDAMPSSAALIDIGASVTSIAIVQDGVSVFWRDIPTGGNQYTDALQRELNLSRDQAEAAKRREAVEGVSTDQVEEILGSVNDDLCHEIQRTVDFVKAFAGSERPLEAIVMSGGGSKLPGLTEVLNRTFGANVEVLDAFRNVNLPPRLATEFSGTGPDVAVASGLAMRKDNDGRINLLEKREPGKSSEKRSSLPSIKLNNPVLVGSLALLLITAGWLSFATWTKSSRLSELEEDIRKANQELTALQKALEKVDQFQAKKDALEQRVQIISDLKRRQVVPVHLLDQVSNELPDYLWLSKLDEQSGAIRMSGKATSYNAVSNFYNNLKESTFFRDVTLGTTKRDREGVSFQLSARFLAPKVANDIATDADAAADVAKGG
jgi:type IV pilus assembly protein PilM